MQTSQKISQEIETLEVKKKELLTNMVEAQEKLEALESSTFDGTVDQILKQAEQAAKQIPIQQILLQSLTHQVNQINTAIAGKQSDLAEALEKERLANLDEAFKGLSEQAEKINLLKDQLAIELIEFGKQTRQAFNFTKNHRILSGDVEFALCGLPKFVIRDSNQRIDIQRVSDKDMLNYLREIK